MYKTLEDFKNQVAKSYGYESYEFYQKCDSSDVDLGHDDWEFHLKMVDEASILYAKYIQEETIKRCAKNALVRHDYNLLADTFSGISEKKFKGHGATFYMVDKKSILNIERILK